MDPKSSEQYRAWIVGGLEFGNHGISYDGNESDNTAMGTDRVDGLDGYGGNDTLFGFGSSDALRGGAGDDHLYGGDGGDSLFGGDGSDFLAGGAGNDYIVGNYFRHYENNSYEDPAQTGSDPVDGVGYKGYDVLQGGRGNDLLLAGEPGVDLGASRAVADYADANYNIIVNLKVADVRYDLGTVNVLVGNTVETDRLGNIPDINAGGGNDFLQGSYVANVFHGGDGKDVMFGDAGNDTLYGDNGDDSLHGGGDADTLYGGANDDALYGDDGDDTLYGESGNNTMFGGNDSDHLYGDAGIDRLSGENGNDFLYGGAYHDYLNGGEGSDVLDGGTSYDEMKGGAGDDTYYVDDVLDTVQDDSGTDTVRTSIVSGYTLGTDIENLDLLGSAHRGTGNNGANVITGTGQGDSLYGKGGNDTLYGNGGADFLYGDSGADTMYGGGGDDTYYVDNAGDLVRENYILGNIAQLGSGIDTVITTVSYALPGQFTAWNLIENLTLAGSANINGTGNGGSNVLRGNAGANVLTGGAGDDTYYIDILDRVVEAASGGTDTVHANFSYSLLGTQIENLVLEGTAAANATGSSGANQIAGNAAVNRIEGGAGSDVLAGGAGADTFVFHLGSGSDVVTDFAAGTGAGHDVMQFDKLQYKDFATLMAHTYAPAGDTVPLTIITDGHDTIQLLTFKSALSAADFLFV